MIEHDFTRFKFADKVSERTIAIELIAMAAKFDFYSWKMKHWAKRLFHKSDIQLTGALWLLLANSCKIYFLTWATATTSYLLALISALQYFHGSLKLKL